MAAIILVCCAALWLHGRLFKKVRKIDDLRERLDGCVRSFFDGVADGSDLDLAKPPEPDGLFSQINVCVLHRDAETDGLLAAYSALKTEAVISLAARYGLSAKVDAIISMGREFDEAVKSYNEKIDKPGWGLLAKIFSLGREVFFMEHLK
ncbi:MAG: hypothetical protein FWF03_04970 [Defluviitaleaceae bacterium]|nr:hypothetical protein [Defluviitaleaceae bacterium]